MLVQVKDTVFRKKENVLILTVQVFIGKQILKLDLYFRFKFIKNTISYFTTLQ